MAVAGATTGTTTSFFTPEHEELRKSIRKFVETELQPHAREWEEARFPPCFSCI